MGKIGTIYVLDRNDMGKYCANDVPACLHEQRPADRPGNSRRDARRLGSTGVLERSPLLGFAERSTDAHSRSIPRPGPSRPPPSRRAGSIFGYPGADSVDLRERHRGRHPVGRRWRAPTHRDMQRRTQLPGSLCIRCDEPRNRCSIRAAKRRTIATFRDPPSSSPPRPSRTARSTSAVNMPFPPTGNSPALSRRRPRVPA